VENEAIIMNTPGNFDRSLASSYVQVQRNKFYRKLVMMGTTAALVLCFNALVTPSQAEFAYMANFGSNNVSGYRIEKNGALRPVPESPFQAGKEPFAAVRARTSHANNKPFAPCARE
jgi:hypothetical protein